MGPVDALLHLANLFGIAIGLGALSAAAAKLLWRHELAGVRWWRLAARSAGAGAIVTVAGLVLGGRDGLMATYGAMVLAAAAALWWSGFGPGRR